MSKRCVSRSRFSVSTSRQAQRRVVCYVCNRIARRTLYSFGGRSIYLWRPEVFTKACEGERYGEGESPDHKRAWGTAYPVISARRPLSTHRAHPSRPPRVDAYSGCVRPRVHEYGYPTS
jgi:hypothetical protein